MSNQDTLLPPLREIHERLTQNARERAILRGLQRLHVRRLRWERQAAESQRDRQEQAT